MKGTKLLCTLGVVAGVTVASIGLAGPASAKPLRHVTVHEETTRVFDNACDVPGLTVQIDRVLDAKMLVNTRGPDDLAFLVEHETVTEVITNLANGTAVTLKFTTNRNSLSVTDNGDGTYTVLLMETGNGVVYGPDGKAIARNPGQVRTELLFDDAGTPTDPFDDVFLGVVRVVKESTGRTDDFCAAIVPVLTG
jgi:hypothetical protein